MSVPYIKFADKKNPEFYKELRKRVNSYFKEKNISKYGNLNMALKSAFMLALYFVPFILMMTGVVHTTWLSIGMWAIMGFGVAGIGLSIMHDANHGSYSKNNFVNKMMGYTLAFAGGYPTNWVIQHNVLHHTFTNIEHFDEDIEKKGVMRFTPNQPHKGLFKYQLFYAPVLYSILTLYWVLMKDFEQIIRYNKMELLEGQQLKLKSALAKIILLKIIYIVTFIVLPIALIELHWSVPVLGFLLMHAIAGLVLALIFQSAHVIEETSFYEADENNSVEENWAILQMHTTANFSNGSRLFSWYIGGLNYQIEHHLFPTICHVHYRSLSKIVKATAAEYNVPYYHHKTFLDALKSHFKLLNDLGTGSYDKQQETLKKVA
ncbi:MAG: fatty acid desaturase [Flavobacteriales bacterium]|nr:fatty acid desaturase [Flavobacteriales bacterium]